MSSFKERTEHTSRPNDSKSKSKRKWDAWSEAEVEGFFRCMNLYGVREFSKTSQALGSKTREQVRHYYYRLLKKINACLVPFGVTVNKQDREEVRKALVCWYNYKKDEGSLTAAPTKDASSSRSLASALYRAITSTNDESTESTSAATTEDEAQSNHSSSKSSPVHSPPMPSVPSPPSNPIPIPTQTQTQTQTTTTQSQKPTQVSDQEIKQEIQEESIHNINNNNNTSSSNIQQHFNNSPSESSSPLPSSSPLLSLSASNSVPYSPSLMPTRLTLQLLPKERQVSEALIRHGYNPFIQLNFSHKKPLCKILEYLTLRWTVPPFSTPIPTTPIRFYPPASPFHPGWGTESNLTAGDLYLKLGSPPVMQVLYSWLEQQQFGGNLNNGTETENSIENEEEELNRLTRKRTWGIMMESSHEINNNNNHSNNNNNNNNNNNYEGNYMNLEGAGMNEEWMMEKRQKYIDTINRVARPSLTESNPITWNEEVGGSNNGGNSGNGNGEVFMGYGGSINNNNSNSSGSSGNHGGFNLSSYLVN